jgi:hypothetical protein
MSDVSAGMNTYVSGPGNPPGNAAPGAAPNGGSAPLAQVSMSTAVFVPLGTAALGLAGLYYLFRRQGGLPPLRVDAANALNVYFSWMLINVPLKVLAYKYHGHKVAQAYLLVA